VTAAEHAATASELMQSSESWHDDGRLVARANAHALTALALAQTVELGPRGRRER
jgi:hypothetical protein